MLPTNLSSYLQRAPQAPDLIEARLISEPPPAGDPAGLHVLAAFLWRRRIIICLAAIGGLLAGVVVSAFMEPVYRARTSLQLEGFNDQAMHNVMPVSQLLPNAAPENYLQNQVKLLESDTLARRVADRITGSSGAVRQKAGGSFANRTTWLLRLFAPKSASGQELSFQKVKKALTVRTTLQSQVIELLFDAPDPDLAARGANGAATEFMNLNREARWQLVQDTTEWLNKQAAELQVKLESLNQELQDYASGAGLLFEGNQNTPAQDRMRQIQEGLSRAEADRAAKQARYEASVKGSGELMSDAIAAGPLRQYESDLLGMQRQLADLSTVYKPDYYKVTRLKAQIAETEFAIAKEKDATIARMRKDYVASAGLENMLRRYLAREYKTVQKQADSARHYDVLRNEVETTQKLYNSVLERTKEAGAESSLRITNVRVIDAATPPLLPYSPNVPMNIAIGLALGALGGIGWVFISARPGKVQHPGDLTFMNLPELGVVPSADTGRLILTAADDPASLAVPFDCQSSLLKESFRAALTSIVFSTDTDQDPHGPVSHLQGRVLVVTSVDMMEGKTTVVTNLGIASAERERRVLLIDADLRRPQLHERLHLPNHRGLTDLLQEQRLYGPLDDQWVTSFAQTTRIPRLSVLTSGPINEESSNLLYSSALQALLPALQSQFDLIFIDAPPMLLYAEARILGRMSDGVVLVVRSNMRSRDELKTASQRLAQDRIRVLGTILNDWKVEPTQAQAYERYQGHYSRRGAGA
jgi:succinoglycan biosynthesis transport protein ExoP